MNAYHAESILLQEYCIADLIVWAVWSERHFFSEAEMVAVLISYLGEAETVQVRCTREESKGKVHKKKKKINKK